MSDKKVLTGTFRLTTGDEAKNKGGAGGGKRSDPEFQQVTAYIRRDTYREVKRAILDAGEREDFSDVVESLLADWLRRRGVRR